MKNKQSIGMGCMGFILMAAVLMNTVLNTEAAGEAFSAESAVLQLSAGTHPGEPIRLPDGSIFDPEYYAEQNPDVVAAVGTDPAALYNHYLIAGKAEGRLPYAGYVSPDAYLATLPQRKLALFQAVIVSLPEGERVCENATVIQNGDHISVQSEYGTGGGSAISSRDHFGPGDVRTDESYFFDYSRYAADYPEVAAIVGNTKEKLWNHFKTQGVWQGLRAYSTSKLLCANARLTAMYELPGAVQGAMTQRDQVRAVHDWMIGWMDYDIDNYLMGTIPHESYYLEGAMLYHTAVCNGYAETFDYFMYLLGIECKVVCGGADGAGGWGGHAWNYVLADGEWRYVDVTWDDNCWEKGSTKPSYNYFMKTEAQIRRDHIVEEYNDPYH